MVPIYSLLKPLVFGSVSVICRLLICSLPIKDLSFIFICIIFDKNGDCICKHGGR